MTQFERLESIHSEIEELIKDEEIKIATYVKQKALLDQAKSMGRKSALKDVYYIVTVAMVDCLSGPEYSEPNY